MNDWLNSALTLHLPLILVMLCAVGWLFVIASWKPEWFRQPVSRLAFWAALEAMACALLWTLGKPVLEDAFGVTGLIDGVIAGAAWGGMALYGKIRFKADLFYEDSARLENLFRR
jgi:hypothetical protein